MWILAPFIPSNSNNSTYERLYDIIITNEDYPILSRNSRRPNSSIPFSILFLTVLAVFSVLHMSMFIVSRNMMSKDSDTARKGDYTLPTLLSVVDPKTGNYISALENELYEHLKHSKFVNRQQAGVVERPQLHINNIYNQARDPLTLSWTNGQDKQGNSLVQDDDVLLLVCGHDRVYKESDNATIKYNAYKLPDFNLLLNNQQQRDFLDAATIEQARATSKKHRRHEYNNRQQKHEQRKHNTQNEIEEAYKENNHEWYFPSFPVFRQDVCQFLFYQKQQQKHHHKSDEYSLVTMSHIFYIQDSITTPTAIHLAYGNSSDSMTVQFTTGASGTPVVMYGTESPSLQRVTGNSHTYGADDMCQEPANLTEPGKFVSPGQLHIVTLSELRHNTIYQYKVGLEHGQGVTWSEDIYTFRSSIPLLASGSENNDTVYPFSYLVYGDQGCPRDGWANGSAWVNAMATKEVLSPNSTIRAVHHFGDLSYAQGAAHIWDEWFHMISSFTTHVPLMIAVGNHEYDHTDGGGFGKDPSGVLTPHGFMPWWGNFNTDSGGECGVPAANRFQMPQSKTSNGIFWYSYDYANIHTIVLSSEHNISKGSRQYTWFEEDLKYIRGGDDDNSSSLWLIVELHRPMYNPELKIPDMLVGIQMRYEIEDLMIQYNVDLVLSGHYHAYHRTCDGLYKSICHNGGPMYITVGTAGAILDNVDIYPNLWTEKYIQQVFAYGKITVYNSSSLHFEMIQAGDDHNDEDSSSATAFGDILDDVWITRDRS